MKSIFHIFQELVDASPLDNETFVVSALPSVKNHKMGISQLGNPVFFIRCEDSNLRMLDVSLELISVQYNRHCLLQNKNNVQENGNYTIVSLKTDSIDLQKYFLDILFLIIKKLPEQVNIRELKSEIEKLISLFSKLSRSSIQTTQGLWAELLVIDQSKNPDYLIRSWHQTPFDRYDFNDGKDKVEVKSSIKSRRVHSFSFEQLRPNTSSELIVASVLMVETGVGISLLDLIKQIEQRLKDDNLSFRINEIVVETLGRDFEKSFEVYYDYEYAKDSLRYYKSDNIPSIGNDIPSVIMNVRFDCDLTDIESIDQIEYESDLHNSLL